MQPELGHAPPGSFLSWTLMALGGKYAILLPGSALVVFVLTLIVVVRGKGPMAGVALALIIPIPLLIGVYAAIEHGISSFNLIAADAGAPGALGHIAEAVSVSLVAPMVGMLLMAPGPARTLSEFGKL